MERFNTVRRFAVVVVLNMADQAPQHHHQPLQFPEGFLWGTATSAHQVEGNNKNNDWWEWEQKPGRLRSGLACDSWHRYQEDFALVHALHNNAHRLSIEWSRVEPREGEFDEQALAHYRQMLQTLKDRQIKVMLTLHHFTNPLWLARRGSWENRQAVFYFERYVRKVVAVLGDLVDFWITINEPLVLVGQSYIIGAWPPEKKNWWTGLKVFRHLAKAHRRAYRAIHEETQQHWGKTAAVGFANNVSSFYAYRKHSLSDQLFVQLFDWIFDHSFYSFTKGAHDFLGLNYYFHYRVTSASAANFQNMLAVRREKREVSDVGWEIYPQGIFEVLTDLQSYGKPIYITENGLATTNDDKRQRFLVSYLKEIYHAIQAGIDIRGYFHWSLLDNFEWEKGFTARFGLIEVDFETQARRPRASFEIYRRLARENAINHDLMHLLGHAIHK